MMVFISYASQDKNIADKICTYLEGHNKSCWIAPRDIPVGKEYGEEIIKGIEQSDAFVLVFSEFSNQSQHVLREVERAVSKKIPIISFKLDDTTLTKSMEYFILATQWLDARANINAALALLDESIDKLLPEAGDMSEIKEQTRIGKRGYRYRNNRLPIIIGGLAGILILIAAVTSSYMLGRKTANSNEVSNNDSLIIGMPETVDQASLDPSLGPSEEQTTGDTALQTEDEGQPTFAVSSEDSDTSIELATNEVTAPKNDQDSNDETTLGQPKDDKAHGQNNTENNNEQNNDAEEVINPKARNITEEPIPTDSMPTKETSDYNALSKLKIGDYIQFGRYYPVGYLEEHKDSEISWVITDINTSTGELTLVSEYILDIMPFDTAESGRFDKDKQGNSYDRNKKETYSHEQMTEFRGNSDWETSNIRTWLNSNQANVKYQDSPPKDSGVDEYCNGYYGRSGFLHDFTDAELDMLQWKDIKTTVNALGQPAYGNGFTLEKGSLSDKVSISSDSYKTTTDRVYLLSVEEVQQYSELGIFKPFTKPTASAAASDHSLWLKVFTSMDQVNYLWATRTPVYSAANLVVTVSTGNAADEFSSYYAAGAGFGIRPAIVIKPGNITLTGEGKSSNPYIIKELMN